MKILWITNILFPDASKFLGLDEVVTGGWLYSEASELAYKKNICLAVATVYPTNKLESFNVNNITYFVIPKNISRSYNKELEFFWIKICSDFNPDIIHIHGTEFSHGLACLRACPNFTYILSIQGLTSIYYRYYYAGISFKEIFQNITLRDILKLDTIFNQKSKFKNQKKNEIEYILNINTITGRTKWDYTHIKTINRNADYYELNRILRSNFYIANKWDYQKVSKYTIFISQGSYPIKGLHQVLKATAILKNDFPLIQVRVGGTDITLNNRLIEKIKISGYGKYIKSLIHKYNLKDNIVFLGSLNENKMINEYQKAHVFVCPSSIENSPNSIAEAQIIGTPVVASYVGGNPDMIIHEESGLLYRFEEYEMLAEFIRKIFLNRNLSEILSINSINITVKRHNKTIIGNKLNDLYIRLKTNST